MNLIKNLLINKFIVIVTLICTFFILEFLLRITPYKFLVQSVSEPKDYYIAHPLTGFDIGINLSPQKHTFTDTKYIIWSNELGCFDSPYKNEETFVYLAGDSFTWGYTPFEDKWGTQLQNLIGTRILKCGVAAFGTRQEYIKASSTLEKIPNNPKLIIIGYLGSNDIVDDNNFPNYTVLDGYKLPNFLKGDVTEEKANKKTENLRSYCLTSIPEHKMIQYVKCQLFVKSVLYNLVKENIKTFLYYVLPDSIIWRIGIVPSQVMSGESLQDNLNIDFHHESILSFKKLAELKKSELLFVLIPSKDDVRALDSEEINSNKETKIFLEKEGIKYIDLLPYFRKYENPPSKPLYWSTDGHWNIYGNHLAGYIVSKYIIDNNLVSSPRKEEVLLEIEGKMESEFGRKGL